jgi:hypothetical protein
MDFFHKLNQRLAKIANPETLNESVAPMAERATGDYSAKKARAGKDIGKPGKMFSKIAKSAGKEYGSKAAGERVAGAVLNKLRHAKEDVTDEGNKFTGNLMNARAAGLKKADLDGDGDMETVREADVVGLGEKKKAKPDYIDLDGDKNEKETMKKAAADKKKSRSTGTAFDPDVAKSMFAHKDDSKYDVKDTGYSKRYTRKEEPEGKDDTEVSDTPKKKGRPKGPAKGPERVTAKSYKYKSGRPAKTQEDLDTDGVMMTRPSNMSSESVDGVPLADKGEYDREGEMAKQQIHTIMRAAKRLHNMLGDDENLPEWVQKKITLAQNYIDGVSDYLASVKAEQGEEMPIAEKAVSVAQRRAAGIAHAAQKGEIPKSKLRRASKEMAKMPKGELKKFATTKEKGLPEKVKEADVEAPKEKKSSGGFQFGKGVYESMNKQYKQALTEGMNITINAGAGDQGEPRKSITVTADGDDADKLAALLKMAGIGGHGESQSCGTCGKAPCGCEELDENSPDWPTNTETSDDALQYSGGLNGPKSTGQTTVPVVASQLRRQVSMEESVKLESDLFRLYQNYKAQ